VPDLEADFGERLNLVTGDNGLGKSFLLDSCWYGLTRTWAGGKKFYPPPDAPKNNHPRIDYKMVGKSGSEIVRQAKYYFKNQTWRIMQVHSPAPGLVIYVRIDGGFSIWDPARNYWGDDDEADDQVTESSYSRSASRVVQRPPAFQFSNQEVWDGLEFDAEGQKKTICNGLLRDIENWRLRGNGSFQLLQKVLKSLSAGEEETLGIGESFRVRMDDLKDIPTLKLPYGIVPVTQAAAGMRRVLALAYLLVWTWDEHCRACELQKEEPASQIVLLFDEVEAHLHPKWQRVFLPSLIKVADSLLVNGQAGAITRDPLKSLDGKADSALKTTPKSVQIIATTHAPLVLASIETIWREEQDKLFIFDLKRVEDSSRPKVTLSETKWAAQGDAVGWLVSDAFGMKQARSKEAEVAIEAADQWMRGERNSLPAGLRSKQAINAELLRVLPGHDPFWPRWIVKGEGRA
jgi:hypothetical protein